VHGTQGFRKVALANFPYLTAALFPVNSQVTGKSENERSDADWRDESTALAPVIDRGAPKALPQNKVYYWGGVDGSIRGRRE
jgi:hypothetical protein